MPSLRARKTQRHQPYAARNHRQIAKHSSYAGGLRPLRKMFIRTGVQTLVTETAPGTRQRVRFIKTSEPAGAATANDDRRSQSPEKFRQRRLPHSSPHCHVLVRLAKPERGGLPDPAIRRAHEMASRRQSSGSCECFAEYTRRWARSTARYGATRSWNSSATSIGGRWQGPPIRVGIQCSRWRALRAASGDSRRAPLPRDSVVRRRSCQKR